MESLLKYIKYDKIDKINEYITHFSLKNGTVKWLKDILIIYNSYLMVIYFQLTPTEISKL